jgi:hypothetical protein
VRDGIALKSAGHPAMVLVHDVFEKAAHAQAAALGMPDLRIYVFPQHRPGEPDEIEVEKAARAAEALDSKLL